MSPKNCAASPRWAAVLLAFGMLGGCSTLPEARFDLPKGETVSGVVSAVDAPFTVSGRLAVKNRNDGFSGALRWRHTADGDEILILSALGQGIARIERRGNAFVLTTAEQKTYEADSAENLTQQVLGWQLPLKGLIYWIQGRVSPASPHHVTRTPLGDIAALEQDGWSIQYAEYGEVGTRRLPSRIEMANGTLRLRLIIDEWQPDV